MGEWPIVRLENYGPIKKAEIELRPLTVLIGRNNMGKSYLASLIYTVGSVFSPRRLYKVRVERPEEVVNCLKQYIRMIVENEIIPEIFARPAEVVRWGASRLLVEIQGNISFVITMDREGDVNVDVNIPHEAIVKTPRILKRPYVIFWRIIKPWSWNTALRRPLYLLAERAGILRVYRPLLVVYLRTSLPVWLPERLRSLLERLEPSMRLPKLAADFLADVLLAPPYGEKIFGGELKILEALMGGRVEVTEELDIIYVVGDKAISLDRASSFIAELAPLYMALERMYRDRSIIIEEPESHVHPRAQVELCRLFARLVRKRVPVLITTHSPLMLIALAHLVGLSGLSPEQRAELGYAENEYLRPEELAIYWLRWDGDGSVAERVRVEPTGTIKELPEMDEVLEDLYGEEARLLELSALASRSAKAVRDK